MIYFDDKRQRWVSDISRTVKMPDGTSKRLRKAKVLPAGFTEKKARLAAEQLEADELSKFMFRPPEANWEEYVRGLVDDKTSWLYRTTARSRNRAKTDKSKHTITPEFLAKLMLKSGGRCAVTGVRFTVDAETNGKKRPFYHSIDRINSDLGYTTSNVRIVCIAVNVAMLNWGDAVFEKIATGYVINSYGINGVLRSDS